MNEKSLQEVLKENHERYIERKKEQDERNKKEQRKTLIITAVAGTFILVLMSKVLINMDDEAMQNCLDKGYSEQTCKVVLR
jgi:hypothetical protein